MNNDGLGAQYQRIVGIICIANYYNFSYVRTPITKMEHLDDLKYLNDIEEFFQIYKHYPSVDSVIYDEIYKKSNPKIGDLIKYNKKNKNILVKIFLPYNICDANTVIYEKGMPKLRTILNNKYLPFYNNNNKKIAIHVRRGDVSNYKNNSRYTPICDIINIINFFKNKYENSSFYIFTQISKNNKNEFDIFNSDTSVQIKANEDLLLTMNHLINADILVMCKSSFSYLAGLYNNNIVYYSAFQHKPLSNWIIIKKINNTNFQFYYYIIIFIFIFIIFYKIYI